MYSSRSREESLDCGSEGRIVPPLLSLAKVTTGRDAEGNACACLYLNGTQRPEGVPGNRSVTSLNFRLSEAPHMNSTFSQLCCRGGGSSKAMEQRTGIAAL